MEGIHDFQTLSIVHAPSGKGGTHFDDLADIPGGRTILSISRIEGSYGLFWNTHALTIQFYYILDDGQEWTPGPRGNSDNLMYGAGFSEALGPSDIIESVVVLNADGQDLGGRIVAYLGFKITNQSDGTIRAIEFGTKSSEFLQSITLPGRVFCSRGRAGMVLDSIQFYHLNKS